MRHNIHSRRRGSAMLEFALAAPLLLLAMAGVLNYSLALRTASCLTDAARAGAWYGSQSASSASDTAGMQAAAQNAAPGIAGMTATASRFCTCSGGTAVSCGGSCASGAMRVYARVRTQAAPPSVFDYPGLSYSGAVTAQVSLRAR